MRRGDSASRYHADHRLRDARDYGFNRGRFKRLAALRGTFWRELEAIGIAHALRLTRARRGRALEERAYRGALRSFARPSVSRVRLRLHFFARLRPRRRRRSTRASRRFHGAPRAPRDEALSPAGHDPSVERRSEPVDHLVEPSVRLSRAAARITSGARSFACFLNSSSTRPFMKSASTGTRRRDHDSRRAD